MRGQNISFYWKKLKIIFEYSVSPSYLQYCISLSVKLRLCLSSYFSVAVVNVTLGPGPAK